MILDEICKNSIVCRQLVDYIIELQNRSQNISEGNMIEIVF